MNASEENELDAPAWSTPRLERLPGRKEVAGFPGGRYDGDWYSSTPGAS